MDPQRSNTFEQSLSLWQQGSWKTQWTARWKPCHQVSQSRRSHPEGYQFLMARSAISRKNKRRFLSSLWAKYPDSQHCVSARERHIQDRCIKFTQPTSLSITQLLAKSLKVRIELSASIWCSCIRLSFMASWYYVDDVSASSEISTTSPQPRTSQSSSFIAFLTTTTNVSTSRLNLPFISSIPPHATTFDLGSPGECASTDITTIFGGKHLSFACQD